MSSSLLAPSLTLPLDTTIFDYHKSNQPAFGWTAYGQPDHYLLQFFARDQGGNCSTTVKKTQVVQDACTWSASNSCAEPGAFTGEPEAVLNPTGYCWNVIAVAQNGMQSPASSTRSFVYGIRPITKLSPGHFPTLAYSDPNPLAADSYGKDLLFQWTPRIGRRRLQIKVDWPFAEIAAGMPNVPFVPTNRRTAPMWTCLPGALHGYTAQRPL